ncbi:MAG: pyridoxamine 5'-phosphate oxidase family protein [Xenococcaceae cyanobacterium]
METATAINGWVNSRDSSNPEVIEKVHRLIESNLYCVLSTCSRDGFPWVSPVFFVYDYDNGYNIYWCSAKQAKHSQNLSSNQGRVAIVIFDSSVREGTGEGLYFSGTASQLDPNQIERVLKLMASRAGKPINRTVQDYLDNSPRRLYHFRPHEAWITGERLPVGNQLVDTKIKVNLQQLSAPDC